MNNNIINYIHCFLSLTMGILLVSCTKQNEKNAMLKRIHDYEDPIATPSRVTPDNISYIRLLSSCECDSTVKTTDIVNAVSSNLLVSSVSPLLQAEGELSLVRVFKFGQVVVSNLVSISHTTSDDCSGLVNIYAWLIHGLRQERGILSRNAAVILERALISGIDWRHRTGNPLFSKLRLIAKQDYMPETCLYMKTNLEDFHKVQFYGSRDSDQIANQTIPEIIRFLDSMTMEPRNYARLQKRAEELRAVLLSKPASQKRDVIVDFFDRLFLADIKLHQAKNLLEEANGVGGNETNCVEKEVNRDIR